MSREFFTFGEFLWDCLPSGRHAGGAPFNAAVHLAQLGGSASLLSSVGRDALGDELWQLARDKGVDTRFVTQVSLPTGVSLCSLDAAGNASYEIVQPAAWDEIHVSEEALAAVGKSAAFIYGTLAERLPFNRAVLEHLLAVSGPLKCFDVNLRPPFVEPELVMHLAWRADVIKVNDEELGQLVSWLRTGEMTPNPLRNERALAEACAALKGATDAARICVTRGAEGAALWEDGELVCVPAPRVMVKDTVGAGDAFLAALMLGLTSGMEPPVILEKACRVGAWVASQDGATPVLPPHIVEEFAQ